MDNDDIIQVVWHNYPGCGAASASFSAVGRYHIKGDMQNMIKEPDCKPARPLKVGWVVTYEFLALADVLLMNHCRTNSKINVATFW